MDKKFDIILVSWNRLDYLKRTVASLIDSGAVRDCQRFIIVDNCSTAEGVQEFLLELKKQFGMFILLRPDNRGWAAAVNDALGLSWAEYLLLSNNDVIYTPGFHQKMLHTMEMITHIGLLGVWRHTSHGYKQGGLHNQIFREMDDVPAIGWMLDKRAMEKVGMLPEHGPCDTKGGNGEDTKYVQMMKASGFLVGVPPEDVATHIDGY